MEVISARTRSALVGQTPSPALRAGALTARPSLFKGWDRHNALIRDALMQPAT